MITIHAETGKPICLGRKGEGKGRQIVFDFSRWRELYGEGTVQLIAQRMGDPDPYPCVIQTDGTHAVWTITSADTAKASQYGKCELLYYFGEDGNVKSEVWQTIVLDALGEPTAEPPEVYQGYVDQVLQAGINSEAAAVRSEAAAERAEKAVEKLSEVRVDGETLII